MSVPTDSLVLRAGTTTTSPVHRASQLPSLTGLRWIAAFFVFAYHLRNMHYFSGHGQQLLSGIFGAGATGVSMFFILSGFVLSWSDDPTVSARRFWQRRLARVYPLHLVTFVAAVFLAASILPEIRTANPWALLSNLTLTSPWNSNWWQAGNAVSWSLACEAFFYFSFPLLMRFIRPLGDRGLIVGAAGSLLVIIAIPVASLIGGLPSILSANSSPAGRLPEFVLGLFLARLMQTNVMKGPRLATALCFTAAGYLAAEIVPQSRLTNTAFTVIGFSLLITALARTDVAGNSTFLGRRLFVFLGTRSFAFYLVHLLVIRTVESGWQGHRPQLPALEGYLLASAAFAVALGLAHVLHETVEKRGRQLLLPRH